MSEPLKTTTTLSIGEDDPRWSLCPDHVDAATFNTAFLAEGWSDAGHSADELRHEYWVPTIGGGWKKSEKDDPRAQPFTVSDW